MLFVTYSNSNNAVQGNIFPSNKTNIDLIVHLVLNKDKLVKISPSSNRFQTCNSVHDYLDFSGESTGSVCTNTGRVWF